MYRAFIIIIIAVFFSCVSRKNEVLENQEKKIIYYENGNIKSEVSLKNNLPDGIESTYYESGRLSGQYEWYLGVQRGNQADFYDFYTDTVITETLNGSMLVAFSAKKKWGYLNKDQKIVCKFVFDKEGRVIDQSGRFVIEAMFKTQKKEQEKIGIGTILFPVLDATILATVFEIDDVGNYSLLDSLDIKEGMIANYSFNVKSKKQNMAVITTIQMPGFQKTDTTVVTHLSE